MADDRKPPAKRKLTRAQQKNREFREAVSDLLHANQHKLSKWLNDVAEGSPAFGRDPDPAKALDLVARLAEYAAPKLGRVEHIGDAVASVTTIEIEFVDSPPLHSISQVNQVSQSVRAINGHGSHAGLAIEAAP